MPRRYFLLPLTCPVATVSSPAVAGDQGWGRASSVGRDALIVAALGIPAVKGDWNGAFHGAGSMAANGPSHEAAGQQTTCLPPVCCR